MYLHFGLSGLATCKCTEKYVNRIVCLHFWFSDLATCLACFAAGGTLACAWAASMCAPWVCRRGDRAWGPPTAGIEPAAEAGLECRQGGVRAWVRRVAGSVCVPCCGGGGRRRNRAWDPPAPKPGHRPLGHLVATSAAGNWARVFRVTGGNTSH